MIAFSPDGSQLVSGGNDKTVRLWDTHGGRLLLSHRQHSQPVAAVAFHPNGRLIASGSEDSSVCLWNLNSGELVTLPEHPNSVRGLAFSADGHWFASCDDDGTIRLWDVKMRQIMHTWQVGAAVSDLLQAIAQGKTQLNEIILAAGMERSPASRYLAILQDLYLVERRVPVTERQPDKSRRGIYRLRDPFLTFWFRFVAPHFSTLEAGYTAPTARVVADELNQFIGPVFENLCREWVTEHAGRGHLPFLPERIGAWWNNEEEIDLVAMSKDAILVGECKWTNHPVGVNILDDLKRKTHLLIQSDQGMRSARPQVHYALFARSGFTPGLETTAGAEGVMLIGPDDLLAEPLVV